MSSAPGSTSPTNGVPGKPCAASRRSARSSPSRAQPASPWPQSCGPWPTAWATRTAVYLWDGDIVPARRAARLRRPARRPDPAAGIVGRCLRTGRAALVPDVSARPGLCRRACRGHERDRRSALRRGRDARRALDRVHPPDAIDGGRPAPCPDGRRTAVRGPRPGSRAAGDRRACAALRGADRLRPGRQFDPGRRRAHARPGRRDRRGVGGRRPRPGGPRPELRAVPGSSRPWWDQREGRRDPDRGRPGHLRPGDGKSRPGLRSPRSLALCAGPARVHRCRRDVDGRNP